MTITTRRNARSILIAWANKQAGWVTALTADLITSNASLTEDQRARNYNRLLVEKELASGSVPEISALEDSEDAPSAEQDLRLRSLTEMRGVNAIVPDQPIAFHNRATLLFGQNGAGKTGYARVIKLLAGSRKAEPVLPNILETQVTPQHALVRYTLGAAEDGTTWKGDPGGVYPLTRIDIFDSRGVSIYLDDELSFAYVPRELALFKSVRDAIDDAKGRLQAAEKAATPAANPFLALFTPGTAVHSAISALSAGTDLNNLRTLASLSQAEMASVEPLEKHVATLQADTTSASGELLSQEKAFAERIKATIEPFTNLDHPAYSVALCKVTEAKATYDAATRKAFGSDGIPGVLEDAWSKFIEAGQAYRDANDMSESVHVGDTCIYCRQALGETAARLAIKYRDYCKASRKPLVEARSAVSKIVKDCLDQDIPGVVLAVDAKLKKVEEGKGVPPLLARMNAALSALRATQDAIQAERGVGAPPDTVMQLLEDLQTETSSLESRILNLKKEGGARQEALQSEQKKLLELKDRVKLAVELPGVARYVENLQWLAKAQTVLKGFQPLAKSLTDAMKDASDLVVNSDFKRHFTDECKALHAPMVRVLFPGSETRAARKKVLNEKYRLSDTLSEGEQRAIALADFLAEAALRTSPSPIVFDDPVNSMDYLRIGYVAQRIAEISEKRQVIVFTHNIWLVAELLERLKKDVRYYDVQDDDGRHGIITEGTTPRIDTPDRLRKKINDRLARAKTQTGEEQYESFEKIYEYMRSFCEVFVETELLAGVSSRFQVEVRMTMLPQIRIDRLAAAIKAVLPIYDDCCRQIASHSKPMEMAGIRPRYTDIEGEWQKLQAVRAEHVGKAP